MKKTALAWLYALRPSTVYALLSRRLRKSLRVNQLLGIEIVSIGHGTAEARLAKRAKVLDETGRVDVSAVFCLAEAAARYAVAGAFAPIAASVRPTALGATAKFLKPAGSDLSAHAMVIGSGLDLRDTVREDGEAEFDIVVDVREAAGAEIAQIIFSWRVTLIVKPDAKALAAPKS